MRRTIDPNIDPTKPSFISLLSKIENKIDDIEFLSKQLLELQEIIKDYRFEQIMKDSRGIKPGDFFEDLSGDVGIFIRGYAGSICWGRYLSKKHVGYVYPKRLLKDSEAIIYLSKLSNKNGEVK